MIQLFVSSR